MKKKKDSISKLADGFVLNIGKDLKRFEKGMSKNEVLKILGEPLSIEKGSSVINEKMTFKICINDFVSSYYTVLFTNNALVYIAKIK